MPTILSNVTKLTLQAYVYAYPALFQSVPAANVLQPVMAVQLLHMATLPQNMTPCEHVSPHTGKILTSPRWRFRSCLGRSMRSVERQNKARSWCKRSAGTSRSSTMPKSILHTPLQPSDGLQCLSMLLVSCKSCVEPSKYYVSQTVVLECRSKMFLHAMQIL